MFQFAISFWYCSKIWTFYRANLLCPSRRSSARPRPRRRKPRSNILMRSSCKLCIRTYNYAVSGKSLTGKCHPCWKTVPTPRPPPSIYGKRPHRSLILAPAWFLLWWHPSFRVSAQFPPFLIIRAPTRWVLLTLRYPQRKSPLLCLLQIQAFRLSAFVSSIRVNNRQNRPSLSTGFPNRNGSFSKPTQGSWEQVLDSLGWYS